MRGSGGGPVLLPPSICLDLLHSFQGWVISIKDEHEMIQASGLTFVAALSDASRLGEDVDEGFATALALSFSSMMIFSTLEPRTQPSTSVF